MKFAFVVAAVLALPLMLDAQTAVTIAPQAHPPAAPAGPALPGFSFPDAFKPPAGVFDQFWNDPALRAELRLTDVQRKQFQDATLKQQLSLIDGGADALKALARLSALLDADQLDEAAYKQQLNSLAAAAGGIVQGVGEMAATPRRVLSLEQWRQLQSLQRARRAQGRFAAAPATRTPPARVP